MGCGASTPVEESPIGETDESRQLNEQLEKQQKEENAIVKLLVLGTGESGKSTVFKQMKILYSVPDPPSKFIMVVRANLFGNAQTVHAGMEKLGIAYKDPAAEEAGKLISSKPADGNTEPTEEVCNAFNVMYKDAGVTEAIERAPEYQLNDSTDYFWLRCESILASDYMPTEQDILRARVRTTGIVQQNFQIKIQKYTMFDVGGQRNERRKWIHCFDNVTAVIFVTAVSEYDQVLYEDENTNRMDEALTLFEQICNHPSFMKTSMILFLNKRDLFEMKLVKKDMTCWDPGSACCGNDYDKAITYIKQKFLDLNKNPAKRQVYAHATCATDTSNVSFVMDSVFDVILKENLRKMDVVDIDKMVAGDSATGKSAAKFPASYAQHTVVLCACWYTETLKERNVLVETPAGTKPPSVEVQANVPFKLNKEGSPEWMSLMNLPKIINTFAQNKAEMGSFVGNFKDAAMLLRTQLGIADSEELGFIYDLPVMMVSPGGSEKQTTLVCLVRTLPSKDAVATKGPWGWVVHETFEDANLKAHFGVDTVAKPCLAPDKNAEFNPFAANPVGDRWFKGVTLFTAQIGRVPDKGVYLGVMKVCSSTEGFSIMVNEHNRIMIPLIFLTCTQLTPEELKWMQGVRIREEKGIDLLEGKKPNRGWLGPEMSGEEGATFAEKMWWAIDEAKSRLDTNSLGMLYDCEVMDVDENSNIQLVMYACIAADESQILPGHIWVDRQFLEVQNMKYMCPKTLQAFLQEQNTLMDDYKLILSQQGGDFEEAKKARIQKESKKVEIEESLKATTPLKWINRTIMWCADKMPSFGDKIEGKKDMDAPTLIDKAIEANTTTAINKEARATLIAKYMK